MIFCFVRETKQLTLEELDRKHPNPTYLSFAKSTNINPEVFSVPTKEFLNYETSVWLPYFIKRHIFRQNIPKPPPIIATSEKNEHSGLGKAVDRYILRRRNVGPEA